MNERTNCENGFRNKAKVIFQLLHFTLNCSTGQSCENWTIAPFFRNTKNLWKYVDEQLVNAPNSDMKKDSAICGNLRNSAGTCGNLRPVSHNIEKSCNNLGESFEINNKNPTPIVPVKISIELNRRDVSQKSRQQNPTKNRPKPDKLWTEIEFHTNSIWLNRLKWIQSSMMLRVFGDVPKIPVILWGIFQFRRWDGAGTRPDAHKNVPDMAKFSRILQNSQWFWQLLINSTKFFLKISKIQFGRLWKKGKKGSKMVKWSARLLAVFTAFLSFFKPDFVVVVAVVVAATVVVAAVVGVSKEGGGEETSDF